MAAEPKPYSQYRHSGEEWLGAVPAHWQVRRLKSWLGVNELVLPEDTDPERTFDYVDIGSVETGRLIARPERLRFGHSPSRARRVVRAGDTIVSMVRTYLKAVWHAARAGPELVASTGFAVLTPRAGTLPRFVSYVCQSEPFANRVTADSVGIAYPAISETRLGTFEVCVPPLPEQRAIVRFLDHADRRIQRYVRAKEKLIGLLEESRSVLIDHAVSRGLDPNAEIQSTRSRVFPAASKEWTSRRIGSLVQRVRRPISVRPDAQYREIGIRSWGKGIFHKDPAPGSVLGEKGVFRIEPGDFVLNIVFAWEGAVAAVSEDERGMIASHRFPTFRPSPDVDLDYLLMVFQSEQGRRLLEVNSPGAAGRNKTLRIGQFLDEEIPLPTLDGQRAIVAAFRERERRLADCVARTRQAVAGLREYRARLVADVVTGKLDVRRAGARVGEVDALDVEAEPGGVDVAPERADWRDGAQAAGPAADVGDAGWPRDS